MSLATFVIYSPIKGNVVDTAVGYKAARARAKNTPFSFVPKDRCIIRREPIGLIVKNVFPTTAQADHADYKAHAEHPEYVEGCRFCEIRGRVLRRYKDIMR